jgi:hypothetical protein
MMGWCGQDWFAARNKILGQVVGPSERGNETSGSIKCGKCD